jgi:hypothetical protein
MRPTHVRLELITNSARFDIVHLGAASTDVEGRSLRSQCGDEAQSIRIEEFRPVDATWEVAASAKLAAAKAKCVSAKPIHLFTTFAENLEQP